MIIKGDGILRTAIRQVGGNGNGDIWLTDLDLTAAELSDYTSWDRYRNSETVGFVAFSGDIDEHEEEPGLIARLYEDS